MITNEEKAIEIATDSKGNIAAFAHIAALEMAQWKDEQFAAEKQALIDKACEILKIRLIGDCMSKESFHYFITKFRKAMEETK